MGKEEMVHIYNGILLSHKKELNKVICSKWMGLETITLREVSQIKTNIICDIHMWNLKR